jgi:thiamine pyrophosphokinase
MEQNSICHVVGAASMKGAVPNVLPGDLCIAADGGWQTLEKLGIPPDFAVGDFDSSEAPTKIPTIRLDPVKDVTDLYAAIQLGKERGYRAFRLYGALGGSWGHSAANLQLLAGLARDGFSAVIVTRNTRAAAIHNGSLELLAANGRRVSVLAFGGKACGVTLKGMRYPLTEAELDCCFPLGVSNELEEDAAEVAVARGTLLIIQEQG